MIWTGKLLFCVASPSACEKDLGIFSDDRRAVVCSEYTNLIAKNYVDTHWGGDGSTDVRPWLVNKT